jgi:hypothetical protein
MTIYDTREGVRLRMNQQREGHWNRWGPFLAERAWGTVREDYSKSGDAWSYFPHDHARSRAYRWNEDGIAGICDRHQYLCFALALWNTHDPILKERMFGLTAHEGNHGEDVKEYYFYLDNTPTHSYMKYLYKYPHAAYPYEQLLEENRRRGKNDMEYELIDTGIFDQGRYFDVVVEYAKVAPEDILIRISVTNRGPETAPIHILPTLWFRNTWSWGRDHRRPSLSSSATPTFKDPQRRSILAKHWQLGDYILDCSGAGELLFAENETNFERLFGSPSRTPYVKDAFHSHLIEGKRQAINPSAIGTKAAAHYQLAVPPGETVSLRLRLAAIADHQPSETPFADFDAVFTLRKEEADEFYAVVLPSKLSEDARLIARQAFAGLLWSKQYYHYVVSDWLDGDPSQPVPPPERLEGRNNDWRHFFTRDVLSMPDKWEFPWFASWDLGFHCVALAYVDPHFAKEQILLMTREWYMHPNGQIPAYEWDFVDVNPPVLSLAAAAVFQIERQATGVADFAFLERVFQKMLLSFTWWVNRKDAMGKNIFQGGFLGMDNIGAFDRDNLPPGYLLGQADGTSWMAAFAKSMLSIALTLAERDPVYEDLASKFWEHYIYIAPPWTILNSRLALFGTNRTASSTITCSPVSMNGSPCAPAPWLDLFLCSAEPPSLPIHSITTPISSGAANGSSNTAPISSPALNPPSLPAPTKCCSLGLFVKTNYAACFPTCWMKMNFSRPLACVLSPVITLLIRWSCIWSARSIAWTTNPANPLPFCLAAIPTGAARFGCPSIS